MAIVINGKELAQKVRLGLKDEVENLKTKGIKPKLAVIMVGNDKASEVYVRNKSKACNEIGIEFEEFLMPEETTREELLNLIKDLNERKDVNGILLQSPIPKHLDIREAFNAIDYRKDVDGFHPINVGKLAIGEQSFVSCTPAGVMKMLEEYGINPEGKRAVVIGRSNIVGKPLSQLLLNANATVTICHSRTQNIKEIAKEADILVAALGKPKFVTADMVKNGAVVIDVGINRTEEGKLVGDVDYENVEPIASYITPVPGGVGPMTIAMLMCNVVKAAKQESKTTGRGFCLKKKLTLKKNNYI